MEYYISINNSKRGPYSVEELKARGLKSATLVMAEGSSQWIPAWQVDELRHIIEASEAVINNSDNSEEPIRAGQPSINGNESSNTGATNDQRIDDFVEGSPIPPQQSSVHQASPQTSYQQGIPTSPTPPPTYQQPRKHGIGCFGKLLILLIIIAAIVGVAVATCPDENAHKAALADVVSEAVNDEVNGTDSTSSDDDMVDKMFRQISDSWTQKVVYTAIDNLISVDNHFVYSTGKVRFGGKEHTVSVGVFGHIFTIDKEDLKKAAEQYYTKAERNVKEDLKKKAADIINDNVIDPAAQAIKEMVNSAMNDIMQDMGIDAEGDGAQQGQDEPADSTSGI